MFYWRQFDQNLATKILLLLPAKAKAYCFQLNFFFSVNTITHEPMHLAWWSFARTCTFTPSRSLLNTKVKGQRAKSHGFSYVFLSVT